MRRYSYIIGVLALFLASCQNDTIVTPDQENLDVTLTKILDGASPTGDLNYFKMPDAQDFSKIPQDPKNPLTKEKVALGAFLFHETAISLDAKEPTEMGKFSCSSCHHVDAGFQAGTFQGIGEGGSGFGNRGEGRSPHSPDATIDVQPLRSPSAMNGAYQPNQLWNGQFGATHLNEGTSAQWTVGTPIETNNLGYEGLEIQAIAGLGVHRMKIDGNIINIAYYKSLFDDAFPDVPESIRYTREFAGLAIAAYERTILSNKAPFQQYLRGQKSAMTDDEKKGAILFFSKANCNQCHTGPALNSMQFNAIGMDDLFKCPEPVINTKAGDPANLGRGSFTKNPADNYKFKVPQLYNLLDSPFYGHGSSLRSIRSVIEYKNKAIPQNSDVPTSQLDKHFVPLGLTNEEVTAIEKFISRGLYDSDLRRYVPTRLPSGQCFPNNDLQSKIDTDCF
ncbi:MAG: cytochrome-c peroxidase [Lewinellaceae bacterium]|nr:cytochrome-c peroxidase [Lewinellaceae bacterium]